MNADEVKRFKEFKWTKRKVLRLFANCLLWVCGPAYLFCSLAAWNLNFAVWHWFLRGVFGVSLWRRCASPYGLSFDGKTPC